jgi:hypothetical protein
LGRRQISWLKQLKLRLWPQAGHHSLTSSVDDQVDLTSSEGVIHQAADVEHVYKRL